MDVRVISHGAHLAAAEREDEPGTDPGALPREHVDGGIAEHPAASGVEGKAMQQGTDHPALGLAALAVADETWVTERSPGGMVQACLHRGEGDPVRCEPLDDGLVGRMDLGDGGVALGGAGLVRDHHEQVAGGMSALKALDHSGVEHHLRRMEGGVDDALLGIPDEGDQGPVAIEQEGSWAEAHEDSIPPAPFMCTVLGREFHGGFAVTFPCGPWRDGPH